MPRFHVNGHQYPTSTTQMFTLAESMFPTVRNNLWQQAKENVYITSTIHTHRPTSVYLLILIWHNPIFGSSDRLRRAGNKVENGWCRNPPGVRWLPDTWPKKAKKRQWTGADPNVWTSSGGNHKNLWIYSCNNTSCTSRTTHKLSGVLNDPLVVALRIQMQLLWVWQGLHSQWA